MEGAKIMLSAKEMQLVSNADWILTKNGIMEKAKQLFGGLQEEMKAHLETIPPAPAVDFTRIPPKISKGENYKGLPYLVLDYPRIFDKQDILAIRTLFWWGNFFSITLHISGSYKKRYAATCSAAYDNLRQEDFFICINEEEWEHHFDASNYMPARDLSLPEWETLIKEKPFIKLAKKYPLHLWGDAINKLSADFRMITGKLLA